MLDAWHGRKKSRMNKYSIAPILATGLDHRSASLHAVNFTSRVAIIIFQVNSYRTLLEHSEYSYEIGDNAAPFIFFIKWLKPI
jgi:hypothetical protein